MYTVIANVIEDNQLRTGAKVYILYCHGMAESPLVWHGQGRKKNREGYFLQNSGHSGCQHIRHRVRWSYKHRADADRRALTSDIGFHVDQRTGFRSCGSPQQRRPDEERSLSHCQQHQVY